MTTILADLIETKLSRREFVRAGALAGAGLWFLQSPLAAATKYADSGFYPLPLKLSDMLELAPGYHYQLLAAWGDPVCRKAPPFHLHNQSPEAQEMQFGFNNDFIAYMPLLRGSNDSGHGLLCVNHEYAIPELMFPGFDPKKDIQKKTREQVAIELSAHGHTVMEIHRTKEGTWEIDRASPYNRRLSARTTYFTLSGPAAGSPRLRTGDDPKGISVLGTLGNCAGGKTPWGTVLIAEENFNHYFTGNPDGTPEARNYKRYGIGKDDQAGWSHCYPRFDIAKELREANRFGWVVEYDPYMPASPPVKRTALGRFKHESATTVLAPDGRVVIYSGDDEAFEYLYRFVSKHRYHPLKREVNRNLLDEGTLYVARFTETELEWRPLIYGNGPLTEAEGFTSQADVLIEARHAAELMGATPMDRPEDIEVAPDSTVYVSLTNNAGRERTDAVNPRPKNIHGHIIALLPPQKNHAADRFTWDILLKGGIEESGLSCPDNLAIGPHGNLWVATDGQPYTFKKSDSLYRVDLTGPKRGKPRRFLNAPRGAEITGPEFTPDGTTLFLSIQHPANEKDSTLDAPSTRWPNKADSNLPPRPAVIAVTRDGGGIIGD